MPNKRFYKRWEAAVKATRRLAVGLNKQTVYLENVVNNKVESREEISESFKRAVVQFASEENTFEVDGMKFKVTCERVE